MVTVKQLFDFLDEKFPIADACDFDNPGLLIGDPGAEVTGVTIALDCTLSVLENAVRTGSNVILTHHPVIFHPLTAVTAGSVPYEAVRKGLSVISMHTNLDAGDGGVNDCLCAAIGLQHVKKAAAHDGFSLRMGELSPISADGLARHLRERLGGVVQYTENGRLIRRVLVCSGSGGDYLSDAASLSCDALVTAEVKHHRFLEAKHAGIALFDAGHFETEDVVIEPLKLLLRSHFQDIPVFTEHSSAIQSI